MCISIYPRVQSHKYLSALMMDETDDLAVNHDVSSGGGWDQGIGFGFHVYEHLPGTLLVGRAVSGQEQRSGAIGWEMVVLKVFEMWISTGMAFSCNGWRLRGETRCQAWG